MALPAVCVLRDVRVVLVCVLALPKPHHSCLRACVRAGEAELEGLARRLRGRFPGLAAGPYAPRRHPIISTQVPRAAQSASAFALGFFGHSVGSSGTHQPLQQQEQQQSSSGHQQNSQHTRSTSRTDASNPSSSNGDASSSSSSSSWSEVVGSWRPQPVAISMLPKRHDPVLRFFESCKGYREHEDRALRWLVSVHGWISAITVLLWRQSVKASHGVSRRLCCNKQQKAANSSA
ncbi:hypothetical protein COO60DRAFT_348968 [Scenedesmus sp. NREL 46B-D3]|nr:hypothetical protein COO60DRAFT_348968 [Scenedesmus sp. NREL 46B-D3]